MYKCADCGNEDKFYGIAKEQGNALIFQNPQRSNGNNGSDIRELVHAVSEGGPFSPGQASGDPASNTVRSDLWAIRNNNDEEITWAYIVSEDYWRGFHEVRSCAICDSTNIVSI